MLRKAIIVKYMLPAYTSSYLIARANFGISGAETNIRYPLKMLGKTAPTNSLLYTGSLDNRDMRGLPPILKGSKVSMYCIYKRSN